MESSNDGTNECLITTDHFAKCDDISIRQVAALVGLDSCRDSARGLANVGTVMRVEVRKIDLYRMEIGQSSGRVMNARKAYLSAFCEGDPCMPAADHRASE